MNHCASVAEDPVAAPRHYRGDGTIECMDALQLMMNSVYCVQPQANGGKAKNIPPTGFYWWGCAFKYLWRWIWKNGVQDLRKCRQRIDYLIDIMEVDDE